MKGDAVLKYGVGQFDSLNARRYHDGGLVQGFAGGGPVHDGVVQRRVTLALVFAQRLLGQSETQRKRRDNETVKAYRASCRSRRRS